MKEYFDEGKKYRNGADCVEREETAAICKPID